SLSMAATRISNTMCGGPLRWRRRGSTTWTSARAEACGGWNAATVWWRAGISDTPGRKATTAELGYIHCGPVGAGHFVKMIHNGIEYGVMQAYAEGFNILDNADSENVPEDCRFNFNLAEIAEVWRRGSVISSWL